MTEEQWIKATETIQSEAVFRGLINPLDILILSHKKGRGQSPAFNWRIALHEFSVRWKKTMLGLMQDKATLRDRPVLFFPVEPTHLSQMIPVARSLARKSVQFCFVTPRIQIFKFLSSRGLPVYLISERNRNLVGGIGTIELRDLKPVLSQFPASFNAFLKRAYPKVVRLSYALQTLLMDFQPVYVFIGNDLTWEGRLLARVSKVLSIRTGMIQHGLLGHEVYNRLHIVDDFYVYGQAFKNVLEEDGLVGPNLIISGAPYLDQKQFDYKGINAGLQDTLDLKGAFVLVALSGPGDRTSEQNYRRALSWINQLINDRPDIEFVIKLHRKESIDAYKAFSTKQQSRIIDRTIASKLSKDIFDLLEGCSCLITGTSAVAYEAMLYRVPIISVDPLKEYHGVNFLDEGVVNVAHAYTDLADALIKVNGRRVDYEPFINNIFGELDGKAALRVFDEMSRFVL